jgi:hypothetical protein
MHLCSLILICIARVSRRICNLGQLQIFKFIFLHELPTSIAASIKFMFPHGLPLSIILCSKKPKIKLLHFFFMTLDALFRLSNLHALEQTKLSYLCHHRRICTFYVELAPSLNYVVCWIISICIRFLY